MEQISEGDYFRTTRTIYASGLFRIKKGTRGKILEVLSEKLFKVKIRDVNGHMNEGYVSPYQIEVKRTTWQKVKKALE